MIHGPVTYGAARLSPARTIIGSRSRLEIGEYVVEPRGVLTGSVAPVAFTAHDRDQPIGSSDHLCATPVLVLDTGSNSASSSPSCDSACDQGSTLDRGRPS